MTKARKLIVYIAASIDGYIAKPGDDLGFLSIVQKEGEDYGYHAFIKTIDTIVLGRKTYEWVMKQVSVFPHADKETYVVTRTAQPNIGLTQFYTGELPALIKSLKEKEGKNIFCDGGAETIHTLLKENCIDEFILSVIPIMVGDGIRLFKEGRPEQGWELVSAKHFETGLVQLHYRLKT